MTLVQARSRLDRFGLCLRMRGAIARTALAISVAIAPAVGFSQGPPSLSGIRSILVVPAVNRSLDVDAPIYLLSAMTIPLAERGYYVFPVNTVKMVLEQEGLYEPEKVFEQRTEELAALFGADAVMYVTIKQWDAKYVILSTVVTVAFDYVLKSATGETLWSATRTMQYSPQQAQGGGSVAAILISAAVAAAATRASPNYMPLTQQANQAAFHIGSGALPEGPYRQTSR